MIDIETYALAKAYTDKAIEGGGAIQGKNCIITEIEDVGNTHIVHFQWTLDDGTVETDTMTVEDGDLVEASETNGNIKINGVETQVYNDAEIKADIDAIDDIISTDEVTKEGNPINFTTLSAQKSKSTILSLEPIQDLHGYDKPWVGGAGKNKCPIDKQNVINGESFSLDSGSYTFSCFASGTPKYSTSSLVIFDSNNTNILQVSYRTNETLSGQFTLSNNSTIHIDVSNVNADSDGYYFRNAQIEVGNEATTYEPYENICPISGRTSVDVVDNSNTITIDLGQTVYGGTLDVENGVLVVDKTNLHITTDMLASFDGNKRITTNNTILKGIDNDDLNEYISSHLTSHINSQTGSMVNEFTVNIYGQIVMRMPNDINTSEEMTAYFTNNDVTICGLLATPITINLTPHTINLLKGVNNISTDGDSITLTYRDGSVATLGDLTSAVDNLDSKIDQSKILTDTATGDKYILVVTNGVLSVQQVSN